jgi:hypothetical protein
MCGPKFWMKITADVRDYAASLTDNEKAALYPDARSTLALIQRRRQRVRAKRGPIINSAPSRRTRPRPACAR